MPSPSGDDLGFFTVSSTDKMRQAASDAAVSALIFITAGSHTHASKLSAMSSLLMSTPNHVPPTNSHKSQQLLYTTAIVTTNYMSNTKAYLVNVWTMTS